MVMVRYMTLDSVREADQVKGDQYYIQNVVFEENGKSNGWELMGYKISRTLQLGGGKCKALVTCRLSGKKVDTNSVRKHMKHFSIVASVFFFGGGG